MALSRREFFKTSGAGLAAGLLGISLDPVEAKARTDARYAKETTTICPYCAVGCGMIVHTLGGNIINVEGDPDHPISEGALCPKGSSVLQLRDNKARITKPMYRAPGAKRLAGGNVGLGAGRDREENQGDPGRNLRRHQQDQGEGEDRGPEVDKEIEAVVNRTMGIASVGSAALDNEECYLYQKFLRGLGLVYIEHQARI